MGAAQSIDFGESMSEPSIDGENLSRTIIASTGPVIFQRFSIRYEFASDAANAIVGACAHCFCPTYAGTNVAHPSDCLGRSY
jgi:hypothetical protein